MPASATASASQLGITQFMRLPQPKPASAAEGVVIIVDTSNDEGSDAPPSSQAAGSVPTLTRRRRINDDDDDEAPSQPGTVVPFHFPGISQAHAEPSAAMITSSNECDDSVTFPVLIESDNCAAPETFRDSGSHLKRSRALETAVKLLRHPHPILYCNVSRCASIPMTAIRMRRSSMRMRYILP